MRALTKQFHLVVVSIALLAWAGAASGAPPEVAPGPLNTCVGGDMMHGDPPVSVEIVVSPDGTIRRTDAVWRLSNPPAGGSYPFALIEFPMSEGAAVARPSYISVFEMVALDPPFPTPTATIVLLVDGVEKTRRPWGLFSQPRPPIPAGSKDAALFGIVPFNPNLADGTPDEGLSSLLDAIGDGTAKRLEVRLIGAKGRIINRNTFDLANPPVRDPERLAADLKSALEKAAAPPHCARQQLPVGG